VTPVSPKYHADLNQKVHNVNSPGIQSNGDDCKPVVEEEFCHLINSN
jgi:hypothetical protein